MWIHRKTTKTIVFAIFFSVLFIFLLLLLFKSCGNTDNKAITETTSTEKTLDFQPYQDNRIVIPGFEGINFQAYTLNQSIVFNNPTENNCYFVISLYLSDNTMIYQSDYLAPGEEITDITLLEPLEKGIYKNCILQYRCFNLANKKELNGSTQTITIKTN